MKLLSLLFALIIMPQLPVYAGVKAKAPIVNGNIQFHANCIQCGGRFVCGATDQNVKLKYLRNYETLSIQEHCYKKSHDISESIRINQNPRTEEAVRYQDYFSQIVLPINENKGGKLLYKQEKGFLYADLFRFTEPTKGLSKSQRKQVIQKARKKVSEMKKDRVLLPVVSMQDYRDFSGNRDRIDIEYQEYVKNLLLLHPSELEERPVGTGIFVKAVAIDEKLKSKFAANFGARATGAANLAGGGSGGAPGSGGEEQQGAQKRGIASKAGSDTIELDENLNVINAKTQKQKNAKEQEAASRALLQKALNEQAKVSVRKLPNFSTSGFKPSTYSYNRNIQSAYDFIAEINRSGDNSLCDVGSTSASQNTIASGSAKVAAAYGADSGLENGSLVAPKIQSTASSALSASSSDECRFKLRSIFNTPEDFRLIAGVEDDAKSAEQVVAQQERQRERGSSLFGGGSRSRSVASTSTPESGELDLDVEIGGVADSISSGTLATYTPGLGSDGTGSQTEGGKIRQTVQRVSSGPDSSTITFDISSTKVSDIGRNTDVSCKNWNKTYESLSALSSLSCKNKEELNICAIEYQRDLKELCTIKFKFKDTRSCIMALKKVVKGNRKQIDYYFNKYPVLKNITPYNKTKGDFKLNSLWELPLLIGNSDPLPKLDKSLEIELCSLANSFNQLSQITTTISPTTQARTGQALPPKGTIPKINKLLNRHPTAKKYIEQIYGPQTLTRLSKVVGLNVDCEIFISMLRSDNRNLKLAKKEIKEILVHNLKGSNDLNKTVTWNDINKLTLTFRPQINFINTKAFGEYTDSESHMETNPFSPKLIRAILKPESLSCDDEKVKTHAT